MSFISIYNKYENVDLGSAFRDISSFDVERTLCSNRLKEKDLIALLSEEAEPFLESIAQKANKITLKNFGKAVQLYTPMYLSDYCENRCVYCGFNPGDKSKSRKLSLEEVRREAEYIASTGLKHILILTGSSRKASPVSYIKDCVHILKEYFSSICIEIYALRSEEYRELIDVGVEGLTLYQEVYDKAVYDKVHLAGVKKDYAFRLDAPERAASEGMRGVNIGALLGLADWRREVFFLALHADYLQNKYPASEVSVSVPRLRPYSGSFTPSVNVNDRNIVQIIMALRLFLPRVGITLSTREEASFRENVLPLGVTRISAGSTTAVGGHTLSSAKEEAISQFDIADKRDVEEVKTMLRTRGYQPVLKDWMHI